MTSKAPGEELQGLGCDGCEGSLLDSLEFDRVFSVRKEGIDRFILREECDQHFSRVLTRREVLALADELRAIVS